MVFDARITSLPWLLFLLLHKCILQSPSEKQSKEIEMFFLYNCLKLYGLYHKSHIS